MKLIAVVILATFWIVCRQASAQGAGTFDEAMALSADQGKPILLEFFVDD